MRVAVALLALALGGCFVQPTTPEAIIAYNAAIASLWTPIVAGIIGGFAFLGLWLKSSSDTRRLETFAARGFEGAGRIAEATARTLALKADATEKNLVTKIDENHAVNVTALAEANGTNAKILKLQEQQAATAAAPVPVVVVADAAHPVPVQPVPQSKGLR